MNNVQKELILLPKCTRNISIKRLIPIIMVKALDQQNNKLILNDYTTLNDKIIN